MSTPSYSTRQLHWYDFHLFFILAVLAGCGLIYEYLMSHYAGRVLGAIETVIFGMIGIMIVAMGIGAFLARYIRCPFTGFAWLEVLIAFLGSLSVLIIATIISFSYTFPFVIAKNFGLPPDLIPSGGIIELMRILANTTPYIIGFIIGVLVGMEIPLVARAREILHQQHLQHNAGAIYGVDYIGAGIGAVIWVGFMLALQPAFAAVLTASANLAIGFLFYALFRQRIRHATPLLLVHFAVASILVCVGLYGQKWEMHLEDLLYQDKVIYRKNTPHQHLVLTERIMNPEQPSILSFYINGRLQFSSYDEQIYHSMLVYPAMAASARHENILIIGGGDGLAIREVLRWQPKNVTLLDIDISVVKLFSEPVVFDGHVINKRLLKMNDYAFSDPRVQVHLGDAFLTVNELLASNQSFDTIIVDLPDPGHPDLSKLYSARFYGKLLTLLSGDGSLVVQSTSPYHAKKAFLSIGKTVKHAGFKHVEQYHHNIPSFGEWGWTIATKQGVSATARIKRLPELTVDDTWISREKILAAFVFSKNFFAEIDSIAINRLGTQSVYQYHHQGWEEEQGIYQP